MVRAVVPHLGSAIALLRSPVLTQTLVWVVPAVLVGWAAAVVSDDINPQRIEELRAAPWFAAPQLMSPHIHLSVMPFVLPLVILFAIFPGLAILVTVVALNLLGDGLRDALDPKTKRTG